MSKKFVIVCDGCGKMLEKTSDIYQIFLKTDSFWDGTETDCAEENLHFCRRCAINIKESLEKIANNNKGGGNHE